MAKSNASYSQFEQMARAAYDGYTAAIDEYIEARKGIVSPSTIAAGAAGGMGGRSGCR